MAALGAVMPTSPLTPEGGAPWILWMNKSNGGSLGNKLLLEHRSHRCGVWSAQRCQGAGDGHPRASSVDAAGNEGRAPVKMKGPGRPATQSCNDPRVSAKRTSPGSALTRPGYGGAP